MAVPCIIDTDPGVDDVLALLLALSSAELSVRAIALTHGNTTLPKALNNLRKLFYALHLHLEAFPDERSRWPGLSSKIDVFLGDQKPIKGEPAVAAYFHGQDGLSNIESRHPTLTPPADFEPPFVLHESARATEGITRLVTESKEQMAYVALGPLTTLSQLPVEIVERFSVIMAMGGAFEAPGNTTPVAEFNMYGDPYAAERVFALPRSIQDKIYLFPLDITRALTLPFETYVDVVDPEFKNTKYPSVPHNKRPITHFTSAILEGTKETVAKFGETELELHDPAVIWAMVVWASYRHSFPDSWQVDRRAFQVENDGTLTRGMFVIDRRPSAKLKKGNRTVEVDSHPELDTVHEAGCHVVSAVSSVKDLRKCILERVWNVSP